MEAAALPPEELPVPGSALPISGRAQRAARHRRGVIPVDLRQRLDRAGGSHGERLCAQLLATELDGLAPAGLDDEERAQLRENYGDRADGALDLLDQIGYGALPGRRERRLRAHGVRREQRLGKLAGKMPRSIALRLPTSADTHRSGPVKGKDRWGEISCSHTLRAGHLLIVAAAGGLWHKRAKPGETFVDVSLSELSFLDNGRGRPGGRDLLEVNRWLADWETVEIKATVTRGRAGYASEAYEIPSSPIAKVERRLGGQWVSMADYAEGLDGADVELARQAVEADGAGSNHGTVRIHLADWFRAELAHEKRNPVFVNFDTWAHLRPGARRLYAFLQGHGRDEYDGQLRFYLASPQRITFGLQGKRRHLWAQSVRDDLTAIVHADKRYRHWHAFEQEGLPGFVVEALEHTPSAPTPEALATKAPAKRPLIIRGAHARIRRASLLRTREVDVDQLDPIRRRQVGDEEALREAAAVRQQIVESLSLSTRARQADPAARLREAQHPPDGASP